MFSKKGQGIFKYVLYLLIALAAIFTTISITSGFIMDFYWFDAVGYRQIFMVNLKYRIFLLIITWVITTGCLLLSWRTIKNAFKDNIPGFIGRLFKAFSVFVGLGVGWWFKDNYLVFLKFLNQAPWGVIDPVFENSISFYVFTLPMINSILTLVGVVAVTVFVLTLFSYAVGRSILLEEAVEDVSSLDDSGPSFLSIEKVLNSGPIIGSLSALTIVGASYVWLSRYSYLWSFDAGSSVPTGASYMAVNYHILYTWVQAAGVLIAGAFFIYALRNIETFREKLEFGDMRDFRNEALLVIALIIIFAIIPSGVFGVINSINVQPNEPGIQQEYIERTINFTNKAYGLDNIVETTYEIDPSENLTSDTALESPTIRNARIIDYRPIQQAYQQRQRLRLYYEFFDVDVDRYKTDNEKRLSVVSAREIDTGSVPKRGGEWQNERLIYTHGFGSVLSPASEVESDGSPILAVSDIPPKSKWENVGVEEPRIYFGEMTDEYVMVGADGLEEFDYPKLGEGDEENRYEYEHDRGVELGNPWRKLIAFFYTGDFNLLVSDYVGPDSSLLLHRNVHERVRKIAPFLRYDSNAHFFIDDQGQQNYLLNGITQARNYPYSYTDREAPGYLSDSVKAFVETNTGDIKFYPIKDDPIVKTFENIYPDLFKEEEMPESYRDHIVYPTDLFEIKMGIYRRYHMEDFRTFYQQEDLWDFADEIYHGSQRRVEAYNILFDVENVSGFEDREDEFMLVKPFTPQGRANMVSWIGVGQDGQNYGQKLELRFPKGDLTRGPMQVESIIDQNTDISQQFSLWDQRGSNILRGNLLVLPVAQDLLYIEPIYLTSANLEYPQLKRMIAVYRDRAVMENSFNRAIRAALGERVERIPTPGDNRAPQELVEIVGKYLDLYNDYIEARNAGNYVEAGKIQEALREIRENMRTISP